MGVVARAAGETLGDVQVGEQATEVLAGVARSDAEKGGKHDGEEGAPDLFAAGEVFFVLLGGSCQRA